MPDSNTLLRSRLASLPISDAERELALERVAQGGAIAEALIALGRLFQHAPALRHAAH